MGMQPPLPPILPITVPVKKIKGAARRWYGGGNGVDWYEKAFTLNSCYDASVDAGPIQRRQRQCQRRHSVWTRLKGLFTLDVCVCVTVKA